MSEPARRLDRPRRRSALAIAAALLLCAGTVHAQATPGTPDQAAIEGAKRHFMQAIALYNDGNFDAALAEFQAAYSTKPAPSILYNIGLTYKALFLYNDAIRSLEQYLRDEPKLQPERRAEVEQLLREMRALLADVSLVITPDGAGVKMDGRTIGRAPIGQYLMAAGRHVLEVTAEGYMTQTKELMITAGVPMTVKIALAIIPKTGRVRVDVEPTGATVKIDERIHTQPVDLELPLGGHTLEVWATGYTTHREELLVAPGQTRDVHVRLSRPTLHKRPAFIAGITVGTIVVAAAISVGIAARLTDGFSQNDIIAGTLTPGSATVGR